MVNTEDAIGAGAGSPGDFSPPGEQEDSVNEQTLGAWMNSSDFSENVAIVSPRQGAPASRRSAAKEIAGGVAIGLAVGALITLVAAVVLLLF